MESRFWSKLVKDVTKVKLRELCSFIGMPDENTLVILNKQPKPIRAAIQVHYSRTMNFATKVFCATIDHDLEPRNVWAVTWESGKNKFCRIFWRKSGKTRWKQADYRHVDVRAAVLQLIQNRREKLVAGVMVS